MKKIEMHCKTKYSVDKDSTIDIEAVLWNAKENGEKGIVFVDKDSIVAFPKIEKVYKKLCEKDKSFKKFKIGYGVQLTSIIDDKESEVIVLVKNQKGLKELYKIMSKYLTEYEKRIPINEILGVDNFLIGLMLNEESIKLDLSLFDYLEVNSDIDISNIKNKEKLVYSNIPNAIFEGELIAKEVSYAHQKIDKVPECRLYKDTEDTLKEFNNKELVITNSNMLFDNLDNIIINDDRFYTTHVDNFCEFENLVINTFNKKYKNPSETLINRLYEELHLIKDLDYTYVYILLLQMTKFIKNEKEYYQLYGPISNSLVAYILEITEMEPYNLPYELFFSESPKIEFTVSPAFYYKKMFKYIMEKFGKELISCNYEVRYCKQSILRVIKHYERKTKKELDSWTKDDICNVLNDIPLYKETKPHKVYLIPKDMDIFDFTPYETGTKFLPSKFKGTHFDYYDLRDNLISLDFVLKDEIKNISNLINKTNSKVEFCNDKRVFNLFRNTEEFGCKFNILDKSTGILNISYFEKFELENKLMKISNISFNDLEEALVNTTHVIIKDELYSNLKKRSLEDIDIFNVMNYLKETKNLLVSKTFVANKVRIAYMQMYYKLYYPKEYYDEMLSNIDFKYINDEVYNYSFDIIKKRYFDLNESKKQDLDSQEYEEFKLLEILIEMYERNIKYSIIDKKIIVN